mmetsp:Transcript_62506/g.145488  ORF Transcript_62506/g.145488 Transcript_62506/m.145488 type:complete len:227 (-) Transcript_62506:119-799(-)
MRENLIKQAIVFLNNPGLASTPTDKKHEFLKGKGLSDEEIDEAMRRVQEGFAATSMSRGAAQPPLRNSAPLGGLPAASGSAVASHGPSKRAALLLLQRRLAELDHERECYAEAVEVLSARADAQPAASPPATVAPTPAPFVLLPTPVQPGLGVAAPTSEASGKADPATSVKKPWETLTGPKLGSVTAPPDNAGAPASKPTRDEEPDLVDEFPPAKLLEFTPPKPKF